MATWVSRGLKQFLCEDFGLPSMEDGDMLSVDETIYRVGFLDDEEPEFLEVWTHNIRENLPWVRLGSTRKFRGWGLNCAEIHEQKIFCVFDQVVDVIAVFHIEKKKWSRLPCSISNTIWKDKNYFGHSLRKSLSDTELWKSLFW